jgi:PiT family inorganic phosphate transporter
VAYVLLGLALLLALGFEFVNGFHDTANAVATCIYTHSMEPHLAVVYSGILNFVGVLVSSGAVAYTIIALLPMELILKFSSGSGFAMVFALLIAAMLWNLATWYKGLPSSSSHTMIGSVIGVGVANGLIHGHAGLNGVQMGQMIKVLEALAISPVIGFVLAGVQYLLFKVIARDPRLYKAPEGEAPPPAYIRALLILTCGGVSFFHGSNDGQKGMGLIMLILVGTVPTAYALNHAVGRQDVARFSIVSTQVAGALERAGGVAAGPGAAPVADRQRELQRFVSTRRLGAQTIPALEQMVTVVRDETTSYGSLGNVPAEMQGRIRNQMYLTDDALGMLPKAGVTMAQGDADAVASYRGMLDRSTKFIPTWVKVAVALALGLGTMFGWKRVAVTVGERIGKAHLTYAQGAAAQFTTMLTIALADVYGAPVSTTHVLSSGVAGTMVANGSGLQLATVRNIAVAWVLTLPAAALLSAGLYWVFSFFVR